MKLRIDKTARRVGIHKLAIPKVPKTIVQIGSQIPKTLGPIKAPKMFKPKSNYGSFPPGHVY